MERKYYDLSAAQNILFHSQKFTLYKQVNNICTTVLVDVELDFDILKKAINIACKRNDSFRIRIVKVDKEMKQYFTKHEDPDIGYLDFRGKSREQMEKKLYKIARKRISNFGKQMSKIYLMHSYDSKCGIYFVVSHMIMDSWAITTFYKDILSIYQALENDTEMPKPLYSYEDLLNVELNYKNTKTYKKDCKFWEKVHDTTEPIFTHINGASVLQNYRDKKKNQQLRYGPFFTFKTKANNIMLEFPKELVKKMEIYCTENKVTMQSLVLHALRNYLAKVNKIDDVSVYTVVARRGTLKEKNTGGSRVHYMPLRTIFDENDTFKNTSEVMNQKLSSVFRHANISPLEVSKIWHNKFKVPQLGTYFVGILTFQPVKLIAEGINIETKWYGNGALSTPFYLTVMDGDGTGSLKFYYEYQKKVFTIDTIKKLHAYIINATKAVIENEDITIGELLSVE